MCSKTINVFSLLHLELMLVLTAIDHIAHFQCLNQKKRLNMITKVYTNSPSITTHFKVSTAQRERQWINIAS
jgi:hypothetical protein